MGKNNNYYEPEMPESLKEFLGIEDDKKLKGTSNKNLNSKKIQKKRPSNATKSQDSNSKKSVSSKRNKVSKDKLKSGGKTNSGVKKKSGSRTPKNIEISSPSSTRKTKSSSSKINDSKKRMTANSSTVRMNKNSKNVEVKGKTKSNVKKNRKDINRKVNSNKRGSVRKKVSRDKNKKKPNILQLILYGIFVFFGFLITGGDKTKYISKEKKSEFDYRFHRNFSLVFIAFVIFVMVLNIIKPNAQTSVAENRDLQQRPKISTSKISDGKFASDYSKYMSDQFIGRSKFIKLKSKFDLLLGKKEINGVYIAKNDYLMEGFKKADDNVTNMKIDSINIFARSNPKLKVSVMVAPNKVEIYKHLLPKNIPVDSQVDYLNSIREKLDPKIKFIDLVDTFERNKNSDELYFKTDHHWTTDGAYLAYVEFCKKQNLEPVNIKSFDKSLASDTFRGSLYYKNGAQIGKPDSLHLYLTQANKPVIVKYYDTKLKVPSLYDVDKLDGRDPYEVFTGGNHTQIKIRTNIDTDRRLLLVKDSYANAMLPFLVDNFSEINIVDLRYFTGSMKDIIHNNDITDVLLLYNVNTFNSDSSILSLNE